MKRTNKNIMVVDTEAIDLNKKFIYDIGFIIAKNNGSELVTQEEHSLIQKQVFQNKMLFFTAHYKKKKPLYTKMLKGRTGKQKHFGHSLRFMEKLMKKYEVQKIFAYNSPFDKDAFKFTIQYFGTRNIFYGKGWYDIHAIANHYIHNTKEYMDYCVENGFITKKGYLQTNAEKTYGFITNNPNYKEIHTGLEDSKIELEILNHCIKNGYDLTHKRKKYIKALDI